MLVRTLRDPFLVGNQQCISWRHAEAESRNGDWLLVFLFFGGGAPRSDSVVASLVAKRRKNKFWGIELVGELRYLGCFGVPKPLGLHENCSDAHLYIRLSYDESAMPTL